MRNSKKEGNMADDDLVKQRFPAEWAKWSTRTGRGASKRRQQLRRAARVAVVMDTLRQAGASCASCASFTKNGPCGSHCEKDSDFHGYAVVCPSDLCARWTARVSVGGEYG